MELAPTCSAEPAMVAEQVPLLSVQVPTVMPPALKVTEPLSAGEEPVEPVGFPPLTIAVSVVEALEAMVVGFADSEVLLVNAVFHLASRLVTLTEPRPVAMS